MNAPKAVLTLDESDPLAHKRNEFLIPPDTIYLDGNSLGPLPHAAAQHVQHIVREQWGNDLIQSWNKHNWIDLPTTVGEKIAPLIGAGAGQVICCDSISVNLFKLLAGALSVNPERKVILSEQTNFPTDVYMAHGLSELLADQGYQLKLTNTAELAESLDESIAVLMLTHVDFRSAAMHDMQQLTQLAHEQGVLVIWDLAHSAGALPLELDEWNVDFAVGCGYKYLNGGPGAPAFVYVAKRWQDSVTQPLTGWMGHKAPFEFDPAYRPAPGAKRFLAGTPNILSLAALDAALDVFAKVSITDIRQKSVTLSELFRELIADEPALSGFTLRSPTDPEQRGSHIALSHPHAFAITQALIEQKVIVDYRAPDIIRFGFCPLYNRYIDIWQTVQILSQIMRQNIHSQTKYQTRKAVT